MSVTIGYRIKPTHNQLLSVTYWEKEQAFALEALPNRDALKYQDKYGLGPDVCGIYRGTLRFRGFRFCLTDIYLSCTDIYVSCVYIYIYTEREKERERERERYIYIYMCVCVYISWHRYSLCTYQLFIMRH